MTDNTNLISSSGSTSPQILWTALSLALGYELQGQIIKGVPCVKRNYQLYCPTAGNAYPLDKIETFIDENKALIKRMYGSFSTPGGGRVRRTPGVPDIHSGDSYFRHVRQANTPLPDPQAANSTALAVVIAGHEHSQSHRSQQYVAGLLGRNKISVGGGSLEEEWGDERDNVLPDSHSLHVMQQRKLIDACESKTEIMTPYWALNSARKVRAIVNTMHFEQAIHQEVCSKKTTSRCSGDCGCEQKYKWHRLLAYDPTDDCAGIFMDWFLFPSCCVCRCNP
ncbi:Protein spaetzle 3 [Eumeta japonica]|uniref:Protein spaetzle 3 n=1 Tax=Eumeta variegata TaxID=151549 RepID=A0A4C1TPJ1_EUMVA|nr:Protein spaetzle 3 [Eumeta japonica]